MQFSSASSTITFNAPDGTPNMTRCYVNAVGSTSAITIQMASGNTVALNGANGSSAGYLVSAGALNDSLCMVSDVAHHWNAWTPNTWTNH
jgi:hypothetical protein